MTFAVSDLEEKVVRIRGRGSKKCTRYRDDLAAKHANTSPLVRWPQRFAEQDPEQRKRRWRTSPISSSSGCDPSPRAGSWVVHGYPFEDAANAKIVAHLIGLLRRMV